MLSILITAYNRQVYIAQAIQSVLNSSYTNFELLIVDDASTDNTVSIARQFETDSRVKLFVNKHNLGQFDNRNYAASLAKAVYIKYLDSDDILYPHSLGIMVEAMLAFPEAALGICEKYHDSTLPYPFSLTPAQSVATHYLQRELLMIGPSGTIIKKSAFFEVGGFENYGMPSDNHLTLKMAGKYPVVILQRDLFWWRPHDGQVSIQNKGNYQNILSNYLFNTDIIVHYSPLSKKENRQVARNQRKIFFMNLFKLSFKKGRFMRAILLLHQYLKRKKV